MSDDRLSELFDLVEVTSILTGGIAERGAWSARSPLHDPVKFFAMVSGRARLSTDGAEPVDLEAGDVAVLIGREWIEFEAGTAPHRSVRPESDFATACFATADRTTDDVLVGGCIDLTPAGRALLLGSLPPLTHVRAADDDSGRLYGALSRLFEEATGNRIGSTFAIRQYGRLLLLELLRAYVARAEVAPGFLRLLTDQRLRPALDLMHDDPARSWNLDELARAAAMSRTTFAVRFRAAAGVPPVGYLNTWRMLLAQSALRGGDIRVGQLAADLGYASESAFSTAFKRVVGESPLRYRQRARSA